MLWIGSWYEQREMILS
uniref:Uncharacterized protein n=1 Tax=Arundo donax TaxID=35708 RepID=A0A0A8ZMU5_ARUDO